MELAKLQEVEEIRHTVGLRNWRIIEHRTGSETMVGRVNHVGFDTDGTFVIHWNERKDNCLHGGLWRTTYFRPSCWQCDVVANIFFLKRTAEDPPERDPINPWHDANLYTLIW
jgi:hypothetical protein